MFGVNVTDETLKRDKPQPQFFLLPLLLPPLPPHSPQTSDVSGKATQSHSELWRAISKYLLYLSQTLIMSSE